MIRAREMLGYGVEKTAEEAGVSKNSVLRAEHGEDIRPGTARKIAAALGVRVADLIGESETLKVEAPSSPEQPPLNGFDDERRADWDVTVHEARQLREHGQARAEELLALWSESKDREEDPAERRSYLDEMGELLQQTYDAISRLFQAMNYERWPEQWPELGKAEDFYRDVWRLFEGAGLKIRTGNAQEERPKAVEESEAA
jgi:transcriptional regulator with XRE-family HTH domain